MTKPSEQEIAAQGQALEAQEWKLPERFRLLGELLALPADDLRKRDPEMYKLWQRTQEQQKIWKQQANEAFGRPSANDMFRAQAAQMSAELLLVIQRLRAEMGKTLTGTSDADPGELQDAIRALRLRRAESLALIGRFDLAASETPDIARRDDYYRILDAVMRPDDEALCECGPHRGAGQQGRLEFPRQYIKKEIYSIAHGQVVFLLACTGCDAMNAVSDLPKPLAKQRAHRARAHQLAAHLPMQEAIAVLASEGHTTQNLMKK